MARISVAELVLEFEKRGEECAYVFRRELRHVRWSYAEVARCARQFAGELEARSIGAQERVLLWGENCAEWVAAFFGCALRGVVAVPMDRGATKEFVTRVAAETSARLMVCSRELVGTVAGVPAIALEDLAGAVGQRPAQRQVPGVGRETVLQVIFTSGTTAEPKGVVLTHGNVLANLEPLEREIAKYLRYERWVHPLRFVQLLPLSHVFGQFMGLYVPQALGATVVFQESLNPVEVMRTIVRERASLCVAVPRMMQSLKQQIEREYERRGVLENFRRELAEGEARHFAVRWWKFARVHRELGWKFWAFICGGSALDEETERFWRGLGFAVVQGYGLTETTSLISVNHPFRMGRRSIGRLLPGSEVKLAEDGEILVRGENIASRYWQSGGPSGAAGGDGWFHTGDLGEFDAEGNLYFKGRKKNVIVTPAGMNVYPADLESALRGQSGVRDCVVVGVEVEGNAEPCAVLLMEEGASVEMAVRAANERLSEYQRLHQWVEWPEPDFPRTATQKPKMAEIEGYVRERGAPARGGIAELIALLKSKDVADASARLEEDLNLTSMERVELMSALEDRYQVDLNEAKFAEVCTVADLQRLVQSGESDAHAYDYPVWPQHWPARWIRAAVYALLTWPATMLMAKPKIVGREHLRHVQGPVLVVSNHITAIDIGFVMAALPWRLRLKLATAMQGEVLREMRHPSTSLPWWRRAYEQLQYWLVVALFNVFPLPQQAGFLKSFAFAGESVDRGYSVLVFPEGRRTTTGEMDKFQAGVGMLASRLGVPVLPIRIDGLFEAKQKRRWLVAPNKIAVRVGELTEYRREENPLSIASALEKRVQGL